MERRAHERRAHERVRYPAGERPELVADYEPGEVLDCSERGARYRAPPGARPAVGAAVEGLLRFRRGAELEVAGVVVRVEGDEVAVHFTRAPVPPGVMLEERRRLRRRD